jgi:hypothetical protein
MTDLMQMLAHGLGLIDWPEAIGSEVQHQLDGHGRQFARQSL